MDPALALAAVGTVAAVVSILTTFYIAKRGGTFRQKDPLLTLGGFRLVNGWVHTVVLGVPVERGPILSSLLFSLTNPGDETIDDLVVTMIVPSVLAGFYDETKHKANIDVSVTRGVDPGTGFKAERVGPHDYLHVTVKSLNPQRPMLLEVPLMFPGAMGKLHFTVPVTFKDGKDADLKMNAQFSVPIEILVMARNRRSQHFTLDLMVYAPPAFGFRPLAWEWLDSLVQEGRDAKSFAKKAMYWCRAFTTFRRCLLILPRYYEREIKSKENKFKNKPISALQQAVGTERYAIGYLVSAFSFYKPLDRRKSSVAPKTPSGY